MLLTPFQSGNQDIRVRQLKRTGMAKKECALCLMTQRTREQIWRSIAWKYGQIRHDMRVLEGKKSRVASLSGKIKMAIHLYKLPDRPIDQTFKLVLMVSLSAGVGIPLP